MKNSIILRSLTILILPVALILIFSLLSSGFGFRSLYIIMSQTMLPFLMALGISLTFIVGIFELSVGSQVILCGIIGGILAQRFGFLGLVIGCVGTGLLLGLIMGTIYRVLRIPTMVISLGMTFVFEAVATFLTTGSGFVKLSDDVAQNAYTPNNFLFGLAAAIIFYIVFYKTKFGFNARALGSNEMIANSLGLSSKKIKPQIYVVSGMFYGVAAVLSICYAGSISAKMSLSSLSMVFPPVISVLIGLQFKSILENFALTILIGAFSVTILFTGLIAVGLPATMQDFLTGVFMLGVMIISVNSSRIRHFYIKKKKYKSVKNSI